MDEEKFEKHQGDKVKMKFVARTPMEAQRIKLEKLMSDPSKPVIIPTAKQKKDFSNAIPSFIRNVMGSSAGAGSGEFHVYRHLRRKEYARQKHIQQKSKQETLDDEYQQRLDENRLKSEGKTSKKRAKRLKKKQNARNKAKIPKIDQSSEKSETESEDDEEEGEEMSNTTQTDETESNKDTTNKIETSNDNNVSNETEATNEPTETTFVSESEGCSQKTAEVDEKEENHETTKETEAVTDVASVKESQ